MPREPHRQEAIDRVRRAGIFAVKETETAPAEIVADSLVAISDGIRKLRAGRLNEKALLILLHHSSGVSQREIKLVLEAMAGLESTYLKRKQ